MPRAVLFDAVGTLIFPDPPVASVYHGAGRAFGSSLDEAEVSRRFHAAFARCSGGDPRALTPTDHQRERERWRGIVAEVFDDVDDAGANLFETLWAHFARPESWKVYDDAAEAWQALERRGLLLGVASNFDDRLADICRGLPLLAGCRNLFWSARSGWPKPSPHFFRGVESALGLAPAEILLVGDDWENDYQGALAAGWSAVFVDRTQRTGFSDAIATLKDLPKWLAT